MEQSVKGCGVNAQPQRMVISECVDGISLSEIVDRYCKWVSVTVTNLLYHPEQIIPGVKYQWDIDNINKLSSEKKYVIRFRSKHFEQHNLSHTILTKRYGKLNINLVSQAIVLFKNNPFKSNWEMVYDS